MKTEIYLKNTNRTFLKTVLGPKTRIRQLAKTKFSPNNDSKIEKTESCRKYQDKTNGEN